MANELATSKSRLDEAILARLTPSQRETILAMEKRVTGLASRLSSARTMLDASGNMIAGAAVSMVGGPTTAVAEALFGKKIGPVQTSEIMAGLSSVAALGTTEMPVAHNAFRTNGQGNVFLASHDRAEPLAAKLAAHFGLGRGTE